MLEHTKLLSHQTNQGHCVWFARKLLSPPRYQAGCCCGWFSQSYQKYNDAVAVVRLHERYARKG